MGRLAWYNLFYHRVIREFVHRGRGFWLQKSVVAQAMQQRAAVPRKGSGSPVPIPSGTFANGWHKRGSSPMSKPVVEVQVRAVVATSGGCAALPDFWIPQIRHYRRGRDEDRVCRSSGG